MAPQFQQNQLNRLQKLLSQLRAEYSLITDGIKRVTKNTRPSGELITTVAEMQLIESYERLVESENVHEKIIAWELDKEPLWTEWMADVRGLGPKMAGVILTEIDITKCDSISALWKYCGLDVVVDAETGEFQSQLSDGQREHDLEIARFNVAAELEDLKLAGSLDSAIDPIRASDGVIRRYRRLWTALKEPKYLDPNDRHAVERAMRSLHDLGFAVEEVEIKLDGDRHQLRFRPKLVEAGYHKQRLFTLTGIQSEELQAKRLLASLDRFYSRIDSPRPVIEDVAKLWLVDVYQKVISEIPKELTGRVEDAQIFHEVLEHRWYLGEQAGRDLGLEYATKSYMETVLPHRTDSGPGEVTEIIS